MGTYHAKHTQISKFTQRKKVVPKDETSWRHRRIPQKIKKHQLIPALNANTQFHQTDKNAKLLLPKSTLLKSSRKNGYLCSFADYPP